MSTSSNVQAHSGQMERFSCQCFTTHWVLWLKKQNTKRRFEREMTVFCMFVWQKSGINNYTTFAYVM